MSTDNTLDDSTSTESPENTDHDPNPDDNPAPIYKEPYKNTTDPAISEPPHSPLGKLYSGDVGDIVRATHLAYGDYHEDSTTDITITRTTTDSTTSTETKETVTKEFRTRSLCYHSELATLDRAIDALEEMPPGYNHFNREAVIKLADNLAPSSKIGVAREGSPAVYIWHNDLPALDDPISEHLPGNKYPDELYVVDTGDIHTYSGRPTGDSLRDQQHNSWKLVRMWGD